MEQLEGEIDHWLPGIRDVRSRLHVVEDVVTIDRRQFVAGLGALTLVPAGGARAAAAADPFQGETALETLAGLGSQVAGVGEGAVLSWFGTEVFNGIFGSGGDPIAAQLDKIIQLENKILRQLADLQNDTDWQAALTRIQPAVTQINAFFVSAQDDVNPPNPEDGAVLQKQILDQGSTGIKSALSVIHQELTGENSIAPGTRGLLQLWRDISWSAYTTQSRATPMSFVRNMQNYLHSVYLVQLKGLTLYVSAVLATKDKKAALPASTKNENQDAALKTAKMVYANMSRQSDVFYDAVGHASDLFNDFAPHPNVSGLPQGIDPRSLVPGFEITMEWFGQTYVLGGTKGDGDLTGETWFVTREWLKRLTKPGYISTEWYLRGDNQLSCYPLIQRITGYRGHDVDELDVQVRVLPGTDNMIEVAEWGTDLAPEGFHVITGDTSHETRVSRFKVTPTGNYFILWGFENLVQPFPSDGKAGPVRCL
jgi:hypothetical protein